MDIFLLEGLCIVNDSKRTIQRHPSVRLEATPDPEKCVYEENPFIFVFWGTWGMFQGSLGIFLEQCVDMASQPRMSTQ